jgi:hypothetical protein
VEYLNGNEAFEVYRDKSLDKKAEDAKKGSLNDERDLEKTGESAKKELKDSGLDLGDAQKLAEVFKEFEHTMMRISPERTIDDNRAQGKGEHFLISDKEAENLKKKLEGLEFTITETPDLLMKAKRGDVELTFVYARNY